jgi:hypothetical protein
MVMTAHRVPVFKPGAVSEETEHDLIAHWQSLPRSLRSYLKKNLLYYEQKSNNAGEIRAKKCIITLLKEAKFRLK